MRQEYHSAHHRLNIMSVAHGLCKALYISKDINMTDHRHMNEMHIIGHTFKIVSMIDTKFLNGIFNLSIVSRCFKMTDLRSWMHMYRYTNAVCIQEREL